MNYSDIQLTPITKIEASIFQINIPSTVEPFIKIEQNGDIYIKGNLIENDKEIVEGFREFFKTYGFIK